MILVTGAFGFIGSNFVKYLNERGIKDIIVCDYLTNGKQFVNLMGCEYSSIITPDKIDRFYLHTGRVDKVFHFGAISDTTEWNGEKVLERNYNFTIDLINYCVDFGVPISYSSSASVYGNGNGPMNLYAFSKWLVDKHVTEHIHGRPRARSIVSGFRYFNVYSHDNSEWHKGDQASPFFKFRQQAYETGEIKIFKGSENFKRDFVHVNRVCEVQWNNWNQNGIFDLGTGQQMSFLQVAELVAEETGARIVEIDFPEHLKGRYQTNTVADMSYLK